MSNKLFKRIITTAGVVACSLCFVVAPETSITAEAATAEESVSPCEEILQWVYRETDGKRYKRLFNCSTGQWVGDWIYIGEA